MVSQNLLNLVDTAMVGAPEIRRRCHEYRGFASLWRRRWPSAPFKRGGAPHRRRRADEAAAPSMERLCARLRRPADRCARLGDALVLPPAQQRPAVMNKACLPPIPPRTLALGGMVGFAVQRLSRIVYMRTLMITHVVNIVLNYLIFSRLLGVVGAASATPLQPASLPIRFKAWLGADKGFLRSLPAGGAALTGGAVGPSERPTNSSLPGSRSVGSL